MSTSSSANPSSKMNNGSVAVNSSFCHVGDNPRECNHIQSAAAASMGQFDTEDKLEPIAVVGMALKFPRDATSPESLWQMIVGGKSARTDVPPERFNINGFHDTLGNRSGQIKARGGHFIQDDITAFDAPFFSVTPNEASCMDPMQRWLLETTYNALEDAGIPIEKARGSRTSVFVGAIGSDFPLMFSRDVQQNQKYRAVGASPSILANRLSWFYEFTGPSMTIDTACSSSLVALDLACQSLRGGSSNTALVGGCNMWMDPELSAGLSELNFLSPDSKCYSFDHRANGYARGEGIGVIVLKPLSKALADNDTVRAVIRASRSSHNGRTPALIQPSCEAQQNLIKDAYLAGGLDSSKTMFVEAHGTGTELGDPLEAAAIGFAFENKARLQPVFVGAIKTNIGHLEGASGIAGVIKTVLILEKAVIPPNIWFEQVNTKIDVEKLKIKFPLEPTVWPTCGLRRASVNSSGFGGANAHVILDDAYNYLKLRKLEGRHNTLKGPPSSESFYGTNQYNHSMGRKNPIQEPDCKIRPRLLVWSAAESDGLKRLYTAYHSHLRAGFPQEAGIPSIADLAWTLSEKRSRLPWKSFLVATSATELQNTLASTTPKGSRANKAPNIVFVFTGQGAQWCGMGRELLEYPIFRDSVRDADTFLRGLGCPWSLLDEISCESPHSMSEDVAYSQPSCTALQVALVELLQSWGVTPAAVIGHSSGEIAAAYCVGGLSRESAWKVAYYRGFVTASLTKSAKCSGSMLAVGTSEVEIRSYFQKLDFKGDQLTVACINSPQNVTVSGSVDLLASLQELLEKDGVFNRHLKVSVAYHSKQMNEVSSSYASLIDDISAGNSLQPETVMFSSVSGVKVLAEDLSYSGYWVANLLSPVIFHRALTNISGLSHKGLLLNHILEIGPHAALRGPVKEYINTISSSSQFTYDSVLIRGQSAFMTTLTAMGNLYCLGQSLDIATINDSRESLSHRQMLLNLPSYPFNHSKRYLAEGRVSRSFRSRAVQHHDLLGTRVSDWNPLNARWQHVIRVSESLWIKDHKINGAIVYPVAGILTMVIEATRQLLSASSGACGYVFKDVVVQKALMVPLEDNGVETQLHLRPNNQPEGRFASWIDFRLYAFEYDEWSEISQGYISIRYSGVSDSESRQICEAYQQGADSCTLECYAGTFYRFLDAHGINFGPSFRGLKNIRVSDSDEAIATSNLLAWQKEAVEAKIQPHVIHPIALDAMLQTGFPALSQGGRKPIATMVPTAIPSLSLFVKDDQACIGDLKIYSKTQLRGFRNSEMSITAIQSESGQPVLTATIECTSASDNRVRVQDEDVDSRRCFYMDWKPDLDLLETPSILSYCSSRARKPTNVDFQMREEKELACHIALKQLSDAKISNFTLNDRPHLQRYLSWMEHRLTQTGVDNVMTRATHLCSLPNYESAITRLFEKVENADAEGKLIVRVARNLLEIFSREVDVLELLFEDHIISDFYEDKHKLSDSFRDVTLYIDALAHKRPDVKILEIGAGTGGATQQILNLLSHNVATDSFNPKFSEYVFTDISPEFFEKARGKNRRLENLITFATLNIEIDPTGQGFAEGAYDIIVASNVLHATKDLRSTLQNTSKMLKSGGKLILMEATTPDKLESGFIFGLLPGWWLGQEENRKWGPLVTRECWHGHLLSSGFSGIDFALPSQENSSNLSVMISTALKANNTASISPIARATDQDCKSVVLPHSILAKVTILVDSNSQLQFGLASQLAERFESVPTLEFEIVALPANFTSSSEQSTCIFLPEFERPFLYGVTSEEYVACQSMVSSAANILWVTRADDSGPDPMRAMVNGLARCLGSENLGKLFVSLALEASQAITSAVVHISKVLQTILTANREDIETEYREIDGRLCVNRVLNSEVLDRHIAQKTGQLGAETATLRQDFSRQLGLTMDSPGLLDTFQFSDVEVLGPLPSDYLDIEVKAAGVNFRDIMIALGYNIGERLGFECSGTVSQASGSSDFQVGDRVVCVVEGALATSVRCETYAAAKIPDGMTFATATAFPVAFLTAYYSIVRLARMQHGESILIHSAAGGFGQACIQTAKIFKAEIYATVGNEDKKRLLIDAYGIKEDRIFSSRTPDFALEIQRLTQGRGVDVIVNSLAGEALKTTWECIAPFGRFLEVGRTETTSSKKLPMVPFSRGASFVGVDLVHVRRSGHLFHELLMETMKLIAEGKYTVPTPLKTYDTSQITSAFRLLESGKSVGKSVITMNDDDMVKIVPSKLPGYSFNADYSYVIAGGLGGLGRSIARWMVSRGAKNLILLSRTSTYSTEIKIFFRELRDKGANLATLACDIGDQEDLASALASCRKMPVIKGCIQGAMVIKSVLFMNMPLEIYQAGVKPKVDGTWNLHRMLPKGMDFFVMLSSVAGITGTPGMANYASGNTFQDDLAQHRVAHGEKATSLDLCVIEDVGYMAEHDHLQESSALRSNANLTEAEFLALLDYHCNPNLPLSTPMQSQVILGVQSMNDVQARNINANFPLNRPLFRIVRQSVAHHNSITRAESDSTVDFTLLIRAAESLDEAADVVADGILTKLSILLAVEKENVDPGKTIATYGVDSLSAVEMRTWFRNVIGAEVTTFEILGNESITALSSTVAAKSSYVKSFPSE